MSHTSISSPPDALLIGLTGGIASGKSIVANYIREQGFPVIEADSLGHQVLEPGHKGYQKIIENFGTGILRHDKTIDRKILGDIVFNAPEKLAQLNEISHPLIAEMLLKEREKLVVEVKASIIFLEAALLIEANWIQYCQQTWVIVTKPHIAIERLKKRNNYNSSQAKARLKAQLNNEERIKHADVVINNNHTIDQLLSQVKKALDTLLASKTNNRN